VGSPARLLTVPEVAEILRVSVSWVYEHADEVGCTRIGGVRFEPDAVYAFIASRRSTCPAPAPVSTAGQSPRSGGPSGPTIRSASIASPRVAETMQRLRRGSRLAS
jgi:hypothetical protein